MVFLAGLQIVALLLLASDCAVYADNAHWYQQPHESGVQHFSLPLDLRNEERDVISSGSLHLFIRGLQGLDGGVLVRGVGFFDPIKNPNIRTPLADHLTPWGAHPSAIPRLYLYHVYKQQHRPVQVWLNSDGHATAAAATTPAQPAAMSNEQLQQANPFADSLSNFLLSGQVADDAALPDDSSDSQASQQKTDHAVQLKPLHFSSFAPSACTMLDSERWVIRVVGSSRMLALSLEEACSVPGPLRIPAAPTFVAFIGHHPNVAAARAAKALQLQASWHHDMGFNRTVLYSNLMYLQALERQEAIQQLVAHGHLCMTAFDYLLPTDGWEYPVARPVAEKHFLLSQWGTNTWAVMLEMEELFVLTTPGTVAAALHDSSSSSSEEPVINKVLLKPVQAVCSHCNASYQAIEHWTGPAFLEKVLSGYCLLPPVSTADPPEYKALLSSEGDHWKQSKIPPPQSPSSSAYVAQLPNLILTTATLPLQLTPMDTASSKYDCQWARPLLNKMQDDKLL